MLLQAMLSVNDMFMTTRESVTSIFLKNIEDSLYRGKVQFTENVTGKSGFNHKFDFVVPRFKRTLNVS
jgi:hypothetical protein